MKPITREVMGVTVFPLIAVVQQIHRWWVVRYLRRYFAADLLLLRIARERKWVTVVEFFNIENRYQFIKLMAKAEKQRGNL
jgi:hypothetical protein